MLNQREKRSQLGFALWIMTRNPRNQVCGEGVFPVQSISGARHDVGHTITIAALRRAVITEKNQQYLSRMIESDIKVQNSEACVCLVP